MPTPTINNILRFDTNKTPILNKIGLASVAAAWSPRKIVKSAQKAIRVRESSADAELDIGFIGENLDVATLKAFVGSNSGYVTTIYDQSGNNNHATQTTKAYQSRIVNAGIVDRDFDASKCAALWPTFASADGVNILKNSNFVGTGLWFSLGSTCTISSANNTLTAIGNGENAAAIVVQDLTYTAPLYKRHFMSLKVRVTNASCINIVLQLRGSTSGSDNIYTITNPVQNQWYTINAVAPATTAPSGFIRFGFYHQYADAATCNGKVMEIQEAMMIDVTEFGQPSLYFDGSNDVMSIANSASVDILGAPLMINGVFGNVAQGGWVINKNASNTTNDTQYGINYDATNATVNSYFEGSFRNSPANASIPNNTQKVLSETFDVAVQQAYVNGVLSGAAGNYNGALTSRANMNIGARSVNAGGTAWAVFFKGYISEIILLRSTTQRTRIEASQLKYFGTK